MHQQIDRTIKLVKAATWLTYLWIMEAWHMWSTNVDQEQQSKRVKITT